jgi:hypothetical protein
VIPDALRSTETCYRENSVSLATVFFLNYYSSPIL